MQEFELLSIAELVTLLSKRMMVEKYTLITVESCTGGWLAKAITDLPGCSSWFGHGYVVYNNRAKQELLNINPEILTTYGAVSAETVSAMVQSALTRGALFCNSKLLAVAISGIAGPDGGSLEQPVGTVWFAWGATGKSMITRCCYFSGQRVQIRRQAVKTALINLLDYL